MKIFSGNKEIEPRDKSVLVGTFIEMEGRRRGRRGAGRCAAGRRWWRATEGGRAVTGAGGSRRGSCTRARARTAFVPRRRFYRRASRTLAPSRSIFRNAGFFHCPITEKRQASPRKHFEAASIEVYSLSGQ